MLLHNKDTAGGGLTSDGYSPEQNLEITETSIVI